MPGRSRFVIVLIGRSGRICGPSLKRFGCRKRSTAFRGGKKERLAELVRELKKQYPADAVLHRKVEHLQRLLSLPSPTP